MAEIARMYLFSGFFLQTNDNQYHSIDNSLFLFSIINMSMNMLMFGPDFGLLLSIADLTRSDSERADVVGGTSDAMKSTQNNIDDPTCMICTKFSRRIRCAIKSNFNDFICRKV